MVVENVSIPAKLYRMGRNRLQSDQKAELRSRFLCNHTCSNSIKLLD